MPLTVSTINNAAGVAKTFVNVGRDRTTAEYLNTSDQDRDTRLFVKTQTVNNGSRKGSNATRRTLVQCVTKIPPSNDGVTAIPELTVTANFTITAPETTAAYGSMNLATKQDAVAFVENFLTNTVVEQLVRGEV